MPWPTRWAFRTIRSSGYVRLSIRRSSRGRRTSISTCSNISITDERDEIVDFSQPYYSAAMAVVTRQPVVDGGATTDIASLKGLIWGAHDANTTAVPMLAEVDQAREGTVALR